MHTPDSPPRRLSELAPELGVSTETLRRAIGAGHLLAERVGNGKGTYYVQPDAWTNYRTYYVRAVPALAHHHSAPQPDTT
ncbi:hypothetical protein [Actinosynnema sp. NPDC023587]|uniref:hypothetical protein n=1 Tax=Actinosynnema sp. NPDC023587 TaxID=3154695 RepID=UPI0033D57F3F